MIPLVIQYAFPRDRITKQNVITKYFSCSNNESINETIIQFIAIFMYDFCYDYGNGSIINSYDDFHNKFWSVNWYEINDWINIFKIFYFENDEWKEWKIQEHKTDVFEYYSRMNR